MTLEPRADHRPKPAGWKIQMESRLHEREGMMIQENNQGENFYPRRLTNP